MECPTTVIFKTDYLIEYHSTSTRNFKFHKGDEVDLIEIEGDKFLVVGENYFVVDDEVLDECFDEKE